MGLFKVLSGTVLSSALMFLAQYSLILTLSPSQFGAISVLFVLVRMLNPVSTLGIHRYLLQLPAFIGVEFITFSRSATRVALLGLMIATVLSFAAALAYNLSGQYEIADLLAYAPFQIALGWFCLNAIAVSQLGGQWLLVGYIPCIVPLSRGFIAVCVIVFGASDATIACSLVVASLIFIVPLAIYLVKQVDSLVRNMEAGNKLTDTRETLVSSWPYCMTGLMNLIYLQIGVVILGFMTTAEEVSIFRVPLIFLGAIYMVPNALFEKYLIPRYVRLFVAKDRQLGKHVAFGVVVGLGVGLLIAILLSVLSSPIMNAVFSYGDLSSRILSIVAFCVPLRLASSSIGAYITSAGWMRIKVRIQMFVAIIAVCSNLISISYLGVVGAGVALLLSEVALILGYAFTYRVLVKSIEKVTV